MPTDLTPADFMQAFLAVGNDAGARAALGVGDLAQGQLNGWTAPGSAEVPAAAAVLTITLPSTTDTSAATLTLSDGTASKDIVTDGVGTTSTWSLFAAFVVANLDGLAMTGTCGFSGGDNFSLVLTSTATGAAATVAASNFATGTAHGGNYVAAVPPSGQTQFVVLKAAPTNNANCWIPRFPAVLGYAWSQSGWSGTIRIGYTLDGETMYAPLLTISPQASDGPFVLAANTPVWNEYSGYGNGQPPFALCAEFVPASSVAADFAGGGLYLFLLVDQVISGW